MEMCSKEEGENPGRSCFVQGVGAAPRAGAGSAGAQEAAMRPRPGLVKGVVWSFSSWRPVHLIKNWSIQEKRMKKKN